MPNMGKWVKSFVRHAGHQPRYWGLHNYVDANRFRTRAPAAAQAHQGRDLVHRDRRDRQAQATSARSPSRSRPRTRPTATRWVFDRLAKLDQTRITRVYLYHWNAQAVIDTWDSALIAHNGVPRPAFRVLRSRLASIAAAAERARLTRPPVDG